MSTTARSIAAALACAAGAVALAAGAVEAPPAVLDALFPEGRRTWSLSALAGLAALAPDEAFRVVPVGRDAHSSHHVVAIRDREVPHRHDRHDLLVVMLVGHGHMRLGDEERPLGEGSILYVPRGTVHAFRNGSGAPAVAHAVSPPASEGEARVAGA
jgi:mannose-6-phosphate isomerase-like protein (cupin superfamily)